MLVFVIPLQSRAASRDWSKVSRLCVRTLQSVCAQRDSQFRAILVCNEPPDGLPLLPELQVVSEKFSMPDATTAERMADKWLKVKRGLIEVRRLAPAYVMIVDADDCVHRDLALWIRSQQSGHGWVLHSGYIWNRGSRWLLKQDRFEESCGTSSIVWCEKADLPRSLDEPNERFPILRFGHTAIVPGCASLGKPLRQLPFRGAVYNVATGENDSGIDLRRWSSRRLKLQRFFRYRPLTRWHRATFGLYEV